MSFTGGSVENRFKVVRYYNDFGVGALEETLGSGLSLEEAERLADSEPPASSDEKIIIQDEEAVGLEEIVRIDSLRESSPS